MGWNTTVVVYNDALDQIRKDPQFGANLAKAVSVLDHDRSRHVDVSSGNYANAAMVVETHHADATALVTVGGNLGVCHLTTYGWLHHERPTQERLLAEWADKLGFTVRRKAGA